MAKKKEIRDVRASDDKKCYSSGTCGKCAGCGLLILGVLVLLNSIFSVAQWDLFAAIVLIIWGVLSLIPGTGCCH